jgi:dTDP-4-amino-4,6-dideoxygalactose transaminase
MNPAETRRIPYAQPLLGAEEEHEVLQVLRSGWLTAGPRVSEFEADFRRYTGSRHALALSSGTSALYLALVSLGIGQGDEVITTPFTFASTANSIVLAGARPVFSDIEPATLNLDPALVEEKITPRTRALAVVHFAGRPVSLDPFRALCAKHGLALIEDATHALGASYRGTAIGSGEHPACFSFYPTKNMTAAEGGMLTTDDPEMADRVRSLRWYGLTEGLWDRHNTASHDFPEVTAPGFKMNMSDLQAAIGICQLRKLDGFNEVRRQYAARYAELLRDVAEIVLPAEDTPEIRSAWHLFVIRIDPARSPLKRREVGTALAARGIGTSYHYKSLHLHRFYRERFHLEAGAFPHAERASDEVISLPLYPKMTPEDVEYVASSLRDVLSSRP